MPIGRLAKRAGRPRSQQRTHASDNGSETSNVNIWSIILGLIFLFGISAVTADQPPISGGITDPNAVLPVPAFDRPLAGIPYTEPVFRTHMRRVSNSSEQGGMEVPTYSQLQAFNADSTLMLLTSSDGYRIRRVSDLS